jgi:cbb3-type cytochrome oxidase subunit 3
MAIAALVLFAILLVAWILAPDGQARKEQAASSPEPVPVTA